MTIYSFSNYNLANNNFEAVKVLIEYGASVTATDFEGRSAGKLAAHKNYSVVSNYLDMRLKYLNEKETSNPADVDFSRVMLVWERFFENACKQTFKDDNYESTQVAEVCDEDVLLDIYFDVGDVYEDDGGGDCEGVHLPGEHYINCYEDKDATNEYSDCDDDDEHKSHGWFQWIFCVGKARSPLQITQQQESQVSVLSLL